MSENDEPVPEDPVSTTTQSGVPYEAALTSALTKLTNQIFLFLIAYTILLIGMATIGGDLSLELRTLLYVIPVLGVAAYVWMQRREAADLRKSEEARRVADADARRAAAVAHAAVQPGVTVRSGEAREDARVMGALGTNPDPNSRIVVESDKASDRAQVIGVSVGEESLPRPVPDLAYLTQLFERLEQEGRDELIVRAQALVKKRAQRRA